MRIHPVILCRGSGTRLWPLSRATYPKQFVALEGGHTLFKDTLRRAVTASDAGKPVLVCNKDHRFYVSSSLQEDGVLLILPSDHALNPADPFYDRVREATPLAEEGRMVTVGIQPASPETAYRSREAFLDSPGDSIDTTPLWNIPILPWLCRWTLPEATWGHGLPSMPSVPRMRQITPQRGRTGRRQFRLLPAQQSPAHRHVRRKNWLSLNSLRNGKG